MPPPPHPQSTPDVARSRSHRGAAGRLGGGTNCWCGTAAAQQPAEGWCPNLGCAPVRTTFRGELARHRARRSAGSPRTRPRSRASTRNSGRHAYEVFEASCGCHLYFDLDGRSAGSMPCGILPTAPPRRRRACCASTFLDSQSQFSFLVSQWPGSVGCFLISVCRLPIEAGIHHNNS